MKNRPIIFSGEMVRAILDGRKTQTRRAMKPQPTNSLLALGELLLSFCQYGRPGDHLWVRETHVFEIYEDEPRSKDGRPIFRHEGDNTEFDEPYWLYPHYRATDPTPDLYYEDDDGLEMGDPMCKWRPSIHMPRWASRITLEIVKVRVEQLQEININSLIAEGVLPDETYLGSNNRYRHSFENLWNLINAKRGYGWDVNP